MATKTSGEIEKEFIDNLKTPSAFQFFAVLSAMWEIEDGFVVDSGSPALRLAIVIQAMMVRKGAPTE